MFILRIQRFTNICTVANEYFVQPVLHENIVWTYSGVRPLYDDGASKAQKITRDYVLKEMGTESAPRILNLRLQLIVNWLKML
ncbi:hypothetical protein MF1_06200 [Bartonella quintana]|nr:hypothetical protein MF1_06200 [Bartonella quintana]